MRMQATVGAVGRHVSAFGIAVGVLCAIGADDTCPTFAVGSGQQQTLLGQPCHHVVSAVVRQADRAQCERISLDRHDTKGITYLR